MSAITDTALQAAPATKARGYWATVGRRIRRDKGQHGLRLHPGADLPVRAAGAVAGLADPYQGSMIRRLRHIGTPNYPLVPTNSAATCWRG